MRDVVGKFPYRSNDPNEATLLGDSQVISKYMRKVLQPRVDIAGIKIQRMDLMEIAFSPEVAGSLLQIQQAQAKVDARKLIVDGAINIVSDALEDLE